MRSNISLYSVIIAVLACASAVCLYVLAMRYAELPGGRYTFSSNDHVTLSMPAFVCMMLWIWWKHPILRFGGYCMALVLLAFCVVKLAIGPVGGDMDFGAPSIAAFASYALALLSAVTFVLCGIVVLLKRRRVTRMTTAK